MSDDSARLLGQLAQSESFRIAIEELTQDEILNRLASMRSHIRAGMDRQAAALEGEITVLEDLFGLIKRAGARAAQPTRL